MEQSGSQQPPVPDDVARDVVMETDVVTPHSMSQIPVSFAPNPTGYITLAPQMTVTTEPVRAPLQSSNHFTAYQPIANVENQFPQNPTGRSRFESSSCSPYPYYDYMQRPTHPSFPNQESTYIAQDLPIAEQSGILSHSQRGDHALQGDANPEVNRTIQCVPTGSFGVLEGQGHDVCGGRPMNEYPVEMFIAPSRSVLPVNSVPMTYSFPNNDLQTQGQDRLVMSATRTLNAPSESSSHNLFSVPQENTGNLFDTPHPPDLPPSTTAQEPGQDEPDYGHVIQEITERTYHQLSNAALTTKAQTPEVHDRHVAEKLRNTEPTPAFSIWQRKKKVRSMKQYDTCQLNWAIYAVQQKRLNLSHAARVFRVPRRTVLHKVKSLACKCSLTYEKKSLPAPCEKSSTIEAKSPPTLQYQASSQQQPASVSAGATRAAVSVDDPNNGIRDTSQHNQLLNSNFYSLLQSCDIPSLSVRPVVTHTASVDTHSSGVNSSTSKRSAGGRRQYERVLLDSAISAVERQYLTASAAARIFQVPRRTISDKVKSRKSQQSVALSRIRKQTKTAVKRPRFDYEQMALTQAISDVRRKLLSQSEAAEKYNVPKNTLIGWLNRIKARGKKLRITQKRPILRYNVKDLEEAIHAVLREGRTISQAASDFNVNRRTLNDRVLRLRRKSGFNNTPGGKPQTSNIEDTHNIFDNSGERGIIIANSVVNYENTQTVQTMFTNNSTICEPLYNNFREKQTLSSQYDVVEKQNAHVVSDNEMSSQQGALVLRQSMTEMSSSSEYVRNIEQGIDAMITVNQKVVAMDTVSDNAVTKQSKDSASGGHTDNGEHSAPLNNGNVKTRLKTKSKNTKIQKRYSCEELSCAIEDVKSNALTVAQAARKYNIPKRTLFDHTMYKLSAKTEIQPNSEESSATTRKYTQEDLRCAIEKATDGTLSITKAAQVYNIPRRTLFDRVMGKTKDISDYDMTAIHLELTAQEEAHLIQYMQRLETIGQPFRRKDFKLNVLEMAARSTRDKTHRFNPSTGPSDLWLRRFLARHTEYQPCTVQSGMYVKGVCNQAGLHTYFDYFEKKLSECDLNDKPSRVFDCSQLYFGKHSRSNEKQVATNEQACAHICVSAAGHVLPTCMVCEQVSDLDLNHENHTWLMARSSNGEMTRELFARWFEEVFIAHCGGDTPVILLIDNSESLINLRVLDLAQQHKVELVVFPQGSSCHLQPLTLAVSGPLLTTFCHLATTQQLTNSKNIIDSHCLPLLWKQTIERTCNPMLLQEGFKRAGLMPFNRHVIEVIRSGKQP